MVVMLIVNKIKSKQNAFNQIIWFHMKLLIIYINIICTYCIQLETENSNTKLSFLDYVLFFQSVNYYSTRNFPAIINFKGGF